MKKVIIAVIFLASCNSPKIKEVVPHVVTNISYNRLFDPVTQQYRSNYIIQIDDSIYRSVSDPNYKVGDTVNFYYYCY
jgi:hypothetical protein